MRMSRATTLFHILLSLRTSATTTPTTSLTPKSPASLFAQRHAKNLSSLPFLYNPNPTSSPKTYATMSSSTTNQPTPNPSTTASQEQGQGQGQEQTPASNTEANKPTLALPDSASASDSQTPQLEVNGDGVKLDHLGPLVVNTDGTLARITNWAQMTEGERKTTLRVLGKRNRERIERLKAKAAEEESSKAE